MKHAAALPLRGPMRILCCPLHLLVCLVCLSLSQPFAALAQANAPAPLPSAAQEALDKGIIAAKVPDYLLAIRFFDEARRLAPQAPVIFMNLGIAESKMPGRELRAIAWFGAYLAAFPDAPNAAAVKEQIAALDVRNQSNVSRLIKSIERPPVQTTSPNALLYTVDQINLVNLRNVAGLWTKAGDIAAAFRTVRLMTGDAYSVGVYRSQAHGVIAEAQAEAGDIVGAKKTAALLQESATADKHRAQTAIAEAQENPAGVAVATSDWLEKLDDEDNHFDHHDCALNSGPFLDLAGYVKSLPSSGNSQTVFDRSFKIAWTLAVAQHIIHQMLNRRARK